MGLISWAKNKVCSAAKKIKEKVKEVKEKVVECRERFVEGCKEAAKTVKEKCTKVYSAVTGKGKFDQAKELYEKLQGRMERGKRDYDVFVERTTDDIEQVVNKINQMKSSLNHQHFQRFIRVSSRIASWDIVLKDLPERFHYDQVRPEGIKNRDELFLIDFDKNPIKSNLKALVSLGFWSRKKATETLHKVQEQEKVLDHELGKLETEKTRLKAVLESLRNVSIYFEELTQVYSGVLDELEYTVNLVANAGYVLNPAYKEEKVDCYLFPKQHLLCLMAADKMTRILFEMTTLRYLSRQGELIESDQSTLKEKRRAVQVITEKLAA